MHRILMIIALFGIGIGFVSCDFAGVNTQTTISEGIIDRENFIEITSLTELQSIKFNKSYKLMSDIDLSGEEWLPIGTHSSPFLGIFDGNGYTISNLKITDDHTFNGLFGYVEGDIINLSLNDVEVNYQANFITYFGGIAGYSNGEITNCSVSGNINILNNNTNSYIGMLVGMTQGKLNKKMLITDFTPNLISNNKTSGMIISINGDFNYIGGLIGKSFNTTVFNNESFVNLDVNAGNIQTYVGGLIGHNFGGILLEYDNLVNQTNIYVKNNIVKTMITINTQKSKCYIGGFIGYNYEGYNLDNFADANINLNATAPQNNLIELGGYIGESWKSSIVNILVKSNYNSQILTHSNFLKSILVGVDNLGIDVKNIYIIVPTNFIDDKYNQISEDLFLDKSFLTDIMGWESDFLNDIK